ncbi:hypothetical protein OF122_06800 [Pelagibacterium flavum]|uniref:Uncharacterized protein n=1 Tax=Pelagibacterium flavum TaxID=2984530 RepID=A0ABY6IS58_9HYPH|nr:hypothetical protein [Pelagibacterium sp. YIM 151497]UYQ73458.1 hypothetical protein OF122_06800 [Pelagibacterium sp. YIM 151497]
MADIEICLAQERRQWSALLEIGDGTPDFFEVLVRKTAPVVPDDRPFWPRWNADSAFTPSMTIGEKYYGLTPELTDGWQEYKARWQRLLELNPRMKIADMLGDVSETHDSSSFPSGWEDVVRDWIRHGMPEPRPFDDRNRMDTPEWRAEFMSAAKAAGPGWVFHADGPEVVFEWRWDDE